MAAERNAQLVLCLCFIVRTIGPLEIAMRNMVRGWLRNIMSFGARFQVQVGSCGL